VKKIAKKILKNLFSNIFQISKKLLMKIFKRCGAEHVITQGRRGEM
tara:strand:+ start:1388 stop:1525 length:138 start_codon:yes stop_codon:yes gene_type:complete